MKQLQKEKEAVELELEEEGELPELLRLLLLEEEDLSDRYVCMYVCTYVC
jgi:hypothetical protein